MTSSTQARRRYRERYYNATFEPGVRSQPTNVTVPDDIERVEHSEPCFRCGIARGPCKHRVAG